ncbi:hypothetical protein [Runella sp. SP2]|uniref:hypothetical protein n=1 Tax=Runella sp. SP2 TaxID=2268026 RepID=UPI000F07A605|nr:hypothetical protein [Runella sp. SP2]AYQ31391.1 hypothetical protein DTQ70_04000 [Runella sp. SP2]
MRGLSHEKRQNLLSKIQSWTNVLDYSQGIKLYRDLYGDTGLYYVFLVGSTSYNQEKLREEIEAAEQILLEEHQVANSNEPEEVKDWRRMTKELLNKRTQLKAQLHVLPTVEERRGHAFEILGISEELDDLFGKLALFEAQGLVYRPIEIETDNPVRRYLNVRSYITKLQKKLKGQILADDIAKTKSKLDEYLLELQSLEKTDEIKGYLER